MRKGFSSRGMAHTSACRARIELAMAEADDPRWKAATDRIAHCLADSVAAPATAAASWSLPDTHVRGPPDDTWEFTGHTRTSMAHMLPAMALGSD